MSKPRLHSGMFTSARDDWRTPPKVFDPLNAEFGFTLDAAATADNALLERYCSPEDSGLLNSWVGERVWCNPPYGSGLAAWVAKLASGEADVAVGFIPARTDTRYFHDLILVKAEIRFLRGRVKFVGAKSSAPFPSMICVWRK